MPPVFADVTNNITKRPRKPIILFIFLL